MKPIDISAGRVSACEIGMRLSRHFEGILKRAGYDGPVAIAGGYLRDVALGRTPKDLDLFLDSGKVNGMTGAEHLASAISNSLLGATLGRAIPCYGSWARDIASVVSVTTTARIGRGSPSGTTSKGGSDVDTEDGLLGTNSHEDSSGWPVGCPAPQSSIDLVVLLRATLSEVGYIPRMVNDAYNQELFLKAVLARVDLRLNAIGATPAFVYASPHWDLDAFHQRLIIQTSRIDDEDRIISRLSRLTDQSNGKYAGWTIENEPAPIALPVSSGDDLSGSASKQ